MDKILQDQQEKHPHSLLHAVAYYWFSSGPSLWALADPESFWRFPSTGYFMVQSPHDIINMQAVLLSFQDIGIEVSKVHKG